MYKFRSVYSNLLMEPNNPEVGEYGENKLAALNGTALEGAVKTAPEDRGGIVQHGQDANASALQQANLLDNKLFRKIMDYHVRKYPFYTALFTKATQMSWKGHKEAEYPEMGDIRTEARTTANISANAYNSANVTKTLSSSNIATNDLAIFRKDYTIFVNGVKGYDEGVTYSADTDNTNGETLMLYVTSVDEANGTVTFKAINGPAVSSGSKDTYVPLIPAGSLLVLGAPALAEEEVEVDPINILPTMRNAYLQKKGYSVAITDFFNEAVKEVDWEKDRIKRQALDTYKKVYTTTALFGAKRKFYKKNKNGNRLVYTQGGLLNQIRMAYQLPGNKWTKEALIGIAKMLFTAYTDSEEIEIFCGSDAIEGLLNIDWGTGVNQITYLKDDAYNIDIATFRCTFGTLRFTHELSLTQHHLEKAAIAVPMSDAMRLYRDNGSTKSVDGNKGETGKVEELTKEFFIQDDCFICNAMNSMIIGPAEIFTSGYTSGVTEQYIAIDAISSSLESSSNVGKIFYLTKVSGNYVAGLYKLCATTTGEGEQATTSYTWESYTRDETCA